MNTAYRTKLTKLGLLSVVMSACIVATGCGGGLKKKSKSVTSSQPVISQLDGPSLAYLSESIKLDNNRNVSAAQWMTIAQHNFASKKYARSLRAATEALNIDEQRVDARQLAMLSAVKVTELNIDSYHDNQLMNSNDKARLRKTLAEITTVINASD